MRKEITRSKYLLMTWSLLILGLVVDGIFYTMLTYAKDPNMTLIGFYSLSSICAGFGLGLAMSRTWKIIGYD